MEHQSKSQPADLIAMARMGDADALGELLESYQSYVQLMATIHLDSKTRHRLSASDVVQETFVQALRSFPQFRGSSEPELLQWLRRIAASRMAMARRRFFSKRQNVRLEQSLFEAMEGWSDRVPKTLGSLDSSPSQRASNREQVVVLANALAKLPDDYRQVILMRHFQELPFAAIAEQMGRSLHSVKHIWARAIKRLQELMVDTSE